MKKITKLLSTILIGTTALLACGCGQKAEPSNADNTTNKQEKSDSFKVVASFYPMDILTMNLTNNIDGVTSSSMSDPNLGCIHDHTFSTEDLKKVEKANVFVENGLKLEVFNDKILKEYPDIKIIEASKDVKDYVKDGDDINAHVWTSVDSYIEQVKTVSDGLQEYNPENKAKYEANETKYIDKLNKLKDDYKDKLSTVAGKKALILDETLPSFCKFLKIDTIEIKTDHEEEALSADTIKKTIAEMKEKNIKNIFIGKDADRSAAEMIAAETGADIYEINTCMVGKVSADAYLNDMKENFETVLKIK